MVNFEEDSNTRDIVNNRIIFPPLLSSCSHDGISSMLRGVLEVEWPHDLGNLLVGEELPNSITCYDDELVFRLKFEPHYLRFTANTHRVSDKVT